MYKLSGNNILAQRQKRHNIRIILGGWVRHIRHSFWLDMARLLADDRIKTERMPMCLWALAKLKCSRRAY